SLRPSPTARLVPMLASHREEPNRWAGDCPWQALPPLAPRSSFLAPRATDDCHLMSACRPLVRDFYRMYLILLVRVRMDRDIFSSLPASAAAIAEFAGMACHLPHRPRSSHVSAVRLSIDRHLTDIRHATGWRVPAQ